MGGVLAHGGGGATTEAVAAHLGKSLGAVYIAKARVMKRIRAKVEELLDAGETS